MPNSPRRLLYKTMPNLGSFIVRVANFMVSTYAAVAKQFADIQK